MPVWAFMLALVGGSIVVTIVLAAHVPAARRHVACTRELRRRDRRGRARRLDRRLPARERGRERSLLDKAKFPRDKPCGGGVTGRAARLLPFSIEPVVEDVVRG